MDAIDAVLIVILGATVRTLMDMAARVWERKKGLR